MPEYLYYPYSNTYQWDNKQTSFMTHAHANEKLVNETMRMRSRGVRTAIAVLLLLCYMTHSPFIHAQEIWTQPDRSSPNLSSYPHVKPQMNEGSAVLEGATASGSDANYILSDWFQRNIDGILITLVTNLFTGILLYRLGKNHERNAALRQIKKQAREKYLSIVKACGGDEFFALFFLCYMGFADLVVQTSTRAPDSHPSLLDLYFRGKANTFSDFTRTFCQAWHEDVGLSDPCLPSQLQHKMLEIFKRIQRGARTRVPRTKRAINVRSKVDRLYFLYALCRQAGSVSERFARTEVENNWISSVLSMLRNNEAVNKELANLFSMPCLKGLGVRDFNEAEDEAFRQADAEGGKSGVEKKEVAACTRRAHREAGRKPISPDLPHEDIVYAIPPRFLVFLTRFLKAGRNSIALSVIRKYLSVFTIQFR